MASVEHRTAAGPRIVPTWEDASERAATDRELLERFVEGGDEGAFGRLVERHAAMVRATCRRVLGEGDGADDAFQAAFLALFDRADALARRGRGESLGAWLHRVAANAAREARRRSRARRRREEVAARRRPEGARGEPPWRDALAALDEEVLALPDGFRRPLVLCDLLGRPQREAADELGLSFGTLRRRLDRARDLLRCRMSRRGFAIAPALLLAWLGDQAAGADGPSLAAIERAVALGRGSLPEPSRVVQLARAARRTLRREGWRRAASVALCAGYALLWPGLLALDTPAVAKARRPAVATRRGPAPGWTAVPRPRAVAPAPAPAPAQPAAEIARSSPGASGTASAPDPALLHLSPLAADDGSQGGAFRAVIEADGRLLTFDDPAEFEEARRRLFGPPRGFGALISRAMAQAAASVLRAAPGTVASRRPGNTDRGPFTQSPSAFFLAAPDPEIEVVPRPLDPMELPPRDR